MNNLLFILKINIQNLNQEKSEFLIEYPNKIIKDYHIFKNIRNKNFELHFIHYHFSESQINSLTISFYLVMKDIKKPILINIINEMKEIQDQNLTFVEYNLLKL